MPEENKEPGAVAAPKKKFELSPSAAILASGALIAGSILLVNLYPATAVSVEQLPAQVNISAPSAGDHRLGSPDAPIVLVEYSDFQCPYCQMVHSTLKRLVEESNGTVAWVYRHLPLTSIHPQAMPAALASECVAEQLGEDGFWKFADAIFADQTKLAPAYYAELAQSFGADPERFASCVAQGTYSAKIKAQSLEAQKNGGSGTPYTIIVGAGEQIPVPGAQPIENFQAVIDAMTARQ